MGCRNSPWISIGLLTLLWLPTLVLAQSRVSQSALETDCLRRLKPIIPGGIVARTSSFSALGNYANYYVVTWRFSDRLEHGLSSASCTYLRNGQWVRDDASAHRQRH